MKYIRKKKVKGNEYYYFEFSFKRPSGKRIIFSDYIGKNLPSSEELKKRLTKNFKKISKIITKNLDKKIFPYFPPRGVQKIEYFRSWYHYLNHELCEKEFKQFQDLFVILFVLNSNRSEGSRVTREEIEKIIKKKKRPSSKIDKEIINSFNALNFAFSNKMKWNLASIKKIHKLLFNGLDDKIAGKLKKKKNIAGSGGVASITTDPKDVKKELISLLEWFNKNKKKIYPPILALEFHWKFEQIHPFQDGNGRVGRILLNAWLLNSFFMPTIFFSENHRTYSNSLAKSIESSKMLMGKYFIQQIEKTFTMVQEYKKQGTIKGGSSSIGKWEIQKGRIKIY